MGDMDMAPDDVTIDNPLESAEKGTSKAAGAKAKAKEKGKKDMESSN
eukprot:SAG22_NODE_402_length_11035_cov_6.315929_4_plen_47_part_00